MHQHQRPTFTEAFPILAVADVAASLAFYRDQIGFTLAYRWPEAASGEIAFAYLTLGQSGLGLGRRGDQHSQTGARFAGNGIQAVDLCVYVDQLDHAVSWLRQHGTPVLVEPVAQPWGERTAYVTDPDGLRLLLIETVAGAAS